MLLPQDAVPNKSESYQQLGNVQLTHLMTATHLPVNSKQEDVLRELEKQGKKPYFIPSGASTHPLGGLGYARCAFEITQQEEEMSDGYFDVIIVPTMSGSTLGGLVAGFKAAEEAMLDSPRKRRLIGVLAGPKDLPQFRGLVLDIAKTAAKHIGVDLERITEVDFEIDDRWTAGQYGRLDEKTHASIKLLASTEGIITDPVYSGKALTGVLEMIKAGDIADKQKVLFLHTGGVMSVSAYSELR